MRRRLAALFALAALGCPGGSVAGHCPGLPLARLTLVPVVDPGRTTCPADQISTVPFAVTITQDQASDVAWACSGRRLSDPLAGTLSGNDLTASATSDGGVFGTCAVTCSVRVTETLDGTLARDLGGAVTGFSGTLMESANADVELSCGACTMPCTVAYTVASP